MGLMAFFVLLVLIGIVLLIVWLARGGGGGGHGRYTYDRNDPAIQAARERYARGEISREELERIENDLRR